MKTKQSVDDVIKSFTQNGDIANLGKTDQSAATHVRDWLSRIDKDSKEARNKRIFNLWLACRTQEEIGKIVGCDKAQVNRICCEMATLPKLNKPDQSAASHATDFTPPIYNVWKVQNKSNSVNHFGNSEQQWLEDRACAAKQG